MSFDVALSFFAPAGAMVIPAPGNHPERRQNRHSILPSAPDCDIFRNGGQPFTIRSGGTQGLRCQGASADFPGDGG